MSRLIDHDRICIDGVWYVREKQASSFDPSAVVASKQLLYEDDDMILEATLMYRNQSFEESECYEDACYVEFTDKREGLLKPDLWDNQSWLRELANGDPIGLEGLEDYELRDDMVQKVIGFMRYLKEREWI